MSNKYKSYNQSPLKVQFSAADADLGLGFCCWPILQLPLHPAAGAAISKHMAWGQSSCQLMKTIAESQFSWEHLPDSSQQLLPHHFAGAKTQLHSFFSLHCNVQACLHSCQLSGRYFILIVYLFTEGEKSHFSFYSHWRTDTFNKLKRLLHSPAAMISKIISIFS